MAEASLITFRRNTLPPYSPGNSFKNYITTEYSSNQLFQNVLKFGEPMIYNSNCYLDGTNQHVCGQLFVGSYSPSNNPNTIIPQYIGPYFSGSAGISVENNYTDQNVGKIKLEVESTDGTITITDHNGKKNFSVTSPGAGGSFSGSVYGSKNMILGGYLWDNTHTLADGSSTSLQSTDFKLAYNAALTFRTYVRPSLDTDLMDMVTVGISPSGNYKHQGAYAFWDTSTHHIITGIEPWFNYHGSAFETSMFHRFPEYTGIVVQSNMLTNVANSYQIASVASGKYYPVVYHNDTFASNTNASPKLAVCIPNSFSSGNIQIFPATSPSYTTSDNRDSTFTTVKYMIELSSDVMFYVDETPTWKSEWYLSNNTGNTINVSFDFININVERIAVFGGNRPVNGVVNVPVEDAKMVKVALFIEDMRVDANNTIMKTAVIEVSNASSYSTVSI